MSASPSIEVGISLDPVVKIVCVHVHIHVYTHEHARTNFTRVCAHVCALKEKSKKFSC